MENDIDILGLQEVDSTLFCKDSPVSRNKSIRQQLIDKYYAYNKKFYIIDYNPQNISNLGAGYTQHKLIIADNADKVDYYCLSRFGKNHKVVCQFGTTEFDYYVYREITIYNFDELTKKYKIKNI